MEEHFFRFSLICENPLSMEALRNGNGASSERIAPIPTPPRLLKTILIPAPFKKLNRVGRGGAGMGNSYTRPTSPRLVFFLNYF